MKSLIFDPPHEITILQSDYGLRLRIVILNGILYAEGSYNDVVSSMIIKPVV